jgi:hypothetical protein
MLSSRKELRANVLSTTRQSQAQIGDLIDEFLNLVISEINNPGWAYGRRDYNHLWNFLKRKTTFATVNGTGDYVLAREVDKIALLRQTDSPIKLTQVPDEKFFELIPNPTDTGNPRWYRLWETDGVATRLAAADTIDVVSSSTSDAGSAELSVSVAGYSSGIWTTETYALNGTTKVSGTVTFDAREIFVSKQKDTTGTVTVTENSGATTLTTLGPDERASRFKIATLYPTPGSAITMYLEFYTRIPGLENDSDVPAFNERWHYVVRLGALAKVYQYLNKETDFATTQSLFASAVRSMVEADKQKPDLIEHLSPRINKFPSIYLRRSESAIA